MKINFYVYTTVLQKKLGSLLPKFQSTKYRESYNFFKTAVQQNRKNIFYPLQHTSTVKETKLHKYFILFVKVVDEQSIILKKTEFYIEEKFHIYGLKKRMTFLETFEYLTLKFRNAFTKIQRLKNKIVFDDGHQIECVLTKNLEECKIFYFKLKQMAISLKITAFLFLGDVPSRPKYIKVKMVSKLVEFTGLSHYQFSRNKTRH